MSAITKQIERKGSGSSPVVGFYPIVRGGICDRCGVLDQNVESTQQYKLCEHYRGKQLMCSYCPDGKDADEVIRHSILRVFDSPDNQNELVVWCNSFECLKRHEERFKINR